MVVRLEEVFYADLAVPRRWVLELPDRYALADAVLGAQSVETWPPWRSAVALPSMLTKTKPCLSSTANCVKHSAAMVNPAVWSTLGTAHTCPS
jgi:hypothetical protein